MNSPLTLLFSAAGEVLNLPAEMRLQRLHEINREMKERKLMARLHEPELKHYR